MKISLLAEFVLPNLPKQLPSSLLQKLKKSMLQVLTQAFVRFKITAILMHTPFVIVILFPYFSKYSNNPNSKQLNTSLSSTSVGVTIIFGSKRVMNGKLHLLRIEASSNLWSCSLVFAMLLRHFNV